MKSAVTIQAKQTANPTVMFCGLNLFHEIAPRFRRVKPEMIKVMPRAARKRRNDVGMKMSASDGW